MSITKETIIDGSNWTLVRGTMPTYNEGLEEYVRKINELRASGVQTPYIHNYILFSDTTLSYKNGLLHLTKGDFIVEKARGISFSELGGIFLSSKEEIRAEQVSQSYLSMEIAYIEELERRVKAPQAFYDTLICNLFSLQASGMGIADNITKFFFDEEIGYTIVDMVPSKASKKSAIPSIVIAAVFGNGMPTLAIDSHELNYVTPVFQQRLDKCIHLLYTKIFLGLQKNGFLMKDIESAFQVTSGLFYTRPIKNVLEMPEKILEVQAFLLGKEGSIARLNFNKAAN